MEPKHKRQHIKPKPFADLSDLANAFRNEKCFIVGAGTSLHKLDLSKIHDHVVISVNSSSLLMPWNRGNAEKRFWISNDSLCLKWSYFWTHVAPVNCTKIIRTSWNKHESLFSKYNGFRYFKPRKSQSNLNLDDPGLCFSSSVPSALDLSIKFGCSEIYLLGVDHKMVNGNSHFWQLWDSKKWPVRKGKKSSYKYKPEHNQQIEVFNKNIPVFEALNKLAMSCKIKVYNCSDTSSLKIFPFLPFDRVFNEKPRRV